MGRRSARKHPRFSLRTLRNRRRRTVFHGVIAVTDLRQHQQQGDIMESLPQNKIVVLGGSRGVGRIIVQTLNAAGAEVLAVARNTDALTVLKREQPEVETLSLDVTDERAPEAVFSDKAGRAGDLRGR